MESVYVEQERKDYLRMVEEAKRRNKKLTDAIQYHSARIRVEFDPSQENIAHFEKVKRTIGWQPDPSLIDEWDYK